jgi:hypothetical protein
MSAIVSDAKWPGMYRLKRADGSVSDMVNLIVAQCSLKQLPERPRAGDNLWLGAPPVLKLRE